MYPPDFDYYAAETVDEAIDLLEAHRDEDPELLAGGHSLIPDMKAGDAAPNVVIDIGDIEALRGVRIDETVTIGAATTYAELLTTDGIEAQAPVIAQATGNVGDTQVRNRGTVGGNLAYAGPEQDLPGAAVAGGAALVLVGPDGERRVDAEALLTPGAEAQIRATEVLTHVEVPAADGDTLGGYVRKTNPVSGYALIGVGISLDMRDGRVQDARVGANGVADEARRLSTVERTLEGRRLDEETVTDAARRAGEGLDQQHLRSNAEASAAFRVSLLETYVERALEELAGQREAEPAAD